MRGRGGEARKTGKPPRVKPQKKTRGTLSISPVRDSKQQHLLGEDINLKKSHWLETQDYGGEVWQPDLAARCPLLLRREVLRLTCSQGTYWVLRERTSPRRGLKEGGKRPDRRREQKKGANKRARATSSATLLRQSDRSSSNGLPPSLGLK